MKTVFFFKTTLPAGAMTTAEVEQLRQQITAQIKEGTVLMDGRFELVEVREIEDGADTAAEFGEITADDLFKGEDYEILKEALE